MRKMRAKKWKYIFFILLFFFLSVSAGLFFLFLAIDIPSIEGFNEREVIQSTKIFDRTGENLLWEIYGEERRTVVPFSEINRNIKNTTIALEDSGFYSHKGISLLAIMRAIIADVLSGRLEQGGSTITQQLVKSTILLPEKTFKRKIKEVIISIKLEQTYSKDEILELYLNEIPYGSNAYGIESASNTFFGKPSADLTLAEAAYLASLPNAPSYYSPYGNHVDELETRKNTALKRMLDLGFITIEEFDEANNEDTIFRSPSDRNIRAPHFVIYVRELLENLYDDGFIKSEGLRVITTLDLSLQNKAEEVVSKYGEKNEEIFNASNAGLVAIDPRNGEILSMVGSRNYFDRENDGNFNIALAKRQPGSAFKPIVYAAAFAGGYTPETVIFDLETEFSADEEESYIPVNYDDEHRGPVTMRAALAQSLNIPSVKVLYLTGLNKSLEMARKLGLTSLNDPDRFGLTLVLGGGEVSLLELTSAYSVFASEGLRSPHRAILRIERSSDSVIYEGNKNKTRVLTKEVSGTINDILSDDVARTPLYGSRSQLFFKDYDIAAKTGTTNDYRDAWIIGHNPRLAVGAWAGNNDNSPMEKKLSGLIITPLWREFMDYALPYLRASEFEFSEPPTYDDVIKPVLDGDWSGSETYVIDKASGKLATEYTPIELVEKRAPVSVHSILHWVDKKNPGGQIPAMPGDDSQYTNWEEPIRKWVDEQGIKEDAPDSMPTEYDDVHSPEFTPVISLKSIVGSPFDNKSIVEIQINSSAVRDLGQLDIFFNETFVRSQSENFSVVKINLGTVSAMSKDNTVTLRLYDDVGNRKELKIPIEIEYQ